MTTEPQDISEDEADLGFQRLELMEMGLLLQPGIVVARILSASDVLVKVLNPFSGEVEYSHRRFGYSKSLGGPSKRPRWRPLSDPVGLEKAAKLIQEFEFSQAKELFPGDIVGIPFAYRKL